MAWTSVTAECAIQSLALYRLSGGAGLECHSLPHSLPPCSCVHYPTLPCLPFPDLASLSYAVLLGTLDKRWMMILLTVMNMTSYHRCVQPTCSLQQGQGRGLLKCGPSFLSWLASPSSSISTCAGPSRHCLGVSQPNGAFLALSPACRGVLPCRPACLPSPPKAKAKAKAKLQQCFAEVPSTTCWECHNLF